MKDTTENNVGGHGKWTKYLTETENEHYSEGRFNNLIGVDGTWREVRHHVELGRSRPDGEHSSKTKTFVRIGGLQNFSHTGDKILFS